ncbi:hypothetical protein DXG03_001955 [Asterophora parasitica]|uniref:Alpha/beta hydrolase fold-3 domain-containing protein n=1 Tax=Asterophora parasitica TaxID=117018 RepID=A0A9P7GC64_9AGAR|nr:hypothetical protein DXG03_001955 [Asterophora parasitica]
MATEQRTIHQPLHPSFTALLDPQYLSFHTSTIQYIVSPHTLPWSPSLRDAQAFPGGSPPLEVVSTLDFVVNEGTGTRVRAFTPNGDVPAGGWPVFLFFHGGGWTLGSIASETSFATNMAHHKGARCIAISVDYRLAPEHPYPAAVEDAVDALLWITREGPKELDVNVARIAVGGSSRYVSPAPLQFHSPKSLNSHHCILHVNDVKTPADSRSFPFSNSGGNLAAILALKAPLLTPPLPAPLVFQLLLVPVIDNTASISEPPHPFVSSYYSQSQITTSANAGGRKGESKGAWASNEHTPWLSPARMLWFRSNYLPKEDDHVKWDASPLFAPPEFMKGISNGNDDDQGVVTQPKVPNAWIGVGELDILCAEGIAYGEKLRREAGVDVRVRVYEGAPHPIMAMDGAVLEIGKQLVTDAAEALAWVFWGTENASDGSDGRVKA